ncbi:MAG TPA: hypothetical protein VHB25_08545 [Gemmatimonadaceae bacterium]|nr:hypothetical protein [Gemmatimonadaceae bacterium]
MTYRNPSTARRRELTQDRVSRVHQPAFLQSVAIGFSNPLLIAERICPTIGVAKQSDLYRVFGRDTLRTHETRWAPGTVPNAITARWSSDSYFCELRKLRIALTDAERNNSDNDLDLEAKYTEKVTNAIDVGREKRVADMFTTAANYSASHKIAKAGGSEYDQAAVLSTAQIILDLQTVASAIAKDAIVPSSMLSVVIPQPVYDAAVKNNTAILDRIKYTQTGVVTTDLLRALLDVKEVIIAQAMYTGSGPETADSDVISAYVPTYLWGDSMWVGLVNAGENEGVPWFARTFRWNGETSGADRQTRVYRDSDEGTEQDWIEVKEARSEKLSFADAGGLITNCLSTM